LYFLKKSIKKIFYSKKKYQKYFFIPSQKKVKEKKDKYTKYG